MKVKSESEVAHSHWTPSNPMDCNLPGSSAHGIFQARVLEWGAIAFSITTSYWLDSSVGLLISQSPPFPSKETNAFQINNLLKTPIL